MTSRIRPAWMPMALPTDSLSAEGIDTAGPVTSGGDRFADLSQDLPGCEHSQAAQRRQLEQCLGLMAGFRHTNQRRLTFDGEIGFRVDAKDQAELLPCPARRYPRSRRRSSGLWIATYCATRRNSAAPSSRPCRFTSSFASMTSRWSAGSPSLRPEAVMALIWPTRCRPLRPNRARSSTGRSWRLGRGSQVRRCSLAWQGREPGPPT